MSNQDPLYASDSPTRSGRPGPPHPVAWGSVLVRMFITVLPGQLIGFGLGGVLLGATGLLTDRPGLSFLTSVVAGVVSGVALGLFLTPEPSRVRVYLAISSALGLVIVLVLVGLAQLRLGSQIDATASSFVFGASLTVVAQALTAWGLWATRTRSR